MEEKIKVLLVTYFPLRDDLSTGNTLINVFSGIEHYYEFANIYIKDGNPHNKIVDRYYHISEKELIKSVITRKSVCSTKRIVNSSHNIDNSKMYNKARELRWDSLLLLQDIVGLLGRWKTKELDEFILEFNPDIVFGPLGRIPLPNVIMKYIHEKFKTKMITYAWDDHYSLNKVAVSPFFWIRTLVERRYIKECANDCLSLFTITKAMKREYEILFRKKCDVISKSYQFISKPDYCVSNDRQIKITYLGNVGAGRFQTIEKVAMAVNSINSEKIVAKLNVYTATPINEKNRKKFEMYKGVSLKKAVPQVKIKEIMCDSDILLYITPIRKKERLLERLSFSTKLVDYFYSARCILCVGGETATTKYLKENNAAIVVNDIKDIEQAIKSLSDNTDTIREYAVNSWECGKNNHQQIVNQKLVLSVINKM